MKRRFLVPLLVLFASVARAQGFTLGPEFRPFPPELVPAGPSASLLATGPNGYLLLWFDAGNSTRASILNDDGTPRNPVGSVILPFARAHYAFWNGSAFSVLAVLSNDIVLGQVGVDGTLISEWKPLARNLLDAVAWNGSRLLLVNRNEELTIESRVFDGAGNLLAGPHTIVPPAENPMSVVAAGATPHSFLLLWISHQTPSFYFWRLNLSGRPIDQAPTFLTSISGFTSGRLVLSDGVNYLIVLGGHKTVLLRPDNVRTELPLPPGGAVDAVWNGTNYLVFTASQQEVTVDAISRNHERISSSAIVTGSLAEFVIAAAKDAITLLGTLERSTASSLVQLRGRNADVEGRPLQVEGKPMVFVGGSASEIHELAFGGGVFILLWSEFDSSSGHRSTYVSRLSPEGMLIGDGFALERALLPRLIWTGDHFLLAWFRPPTAGPGMDLVALV